LHLKKLLSADLSLEAMNSAIQMLTQEELGNFRECVESLEKQCWDEDRFVSDVTDKKNHTHL
jgi:hypothetical protein